MMYSRIMKARAPESSEATPLGNLSFPKAPAAASGDHSPALQFLRLACLLETGSVATRQAIAEELRLLSSSVSLASLGVEQYSLAVRSLSRAIGNSRDYHLRRSLIQAFGHIGERATASQLKTLIATILPLIYRRQVWGGLEIAQGEVQGVLDLLVQLNKRLILLELP